MLTIPNLLGADELTQIHALMDRALYDDGRHTAGGLAKAIKSNRQVSRQWEGIAALDAIVEGALRRTAVVREALSPCAHSQVIYSRYATGDGYGPHVDAVMSGMPPMRHDISMTIFLSPPEAYAGGELAITPPDGPPSLAKLAAGDAIAYPTTAIHEVRQVAAGERRVAVLWLQSFFRDPLIREIVADLRRSIEAVKKLPGGDPVLLMKVLANVERAFIAT